MTFLCRLLCVLALVAALLVPATSVADNDDGPSAGALVASVVTHAGAQVEGTLEPDDEETTWWVEYRASGSALASTPRVTVAGDRDHEPVTVTASLSGLPASTRVEARLVAQSSEDDDSGRRLIFTTAAAPVASPPAETPSAPAAPADPASQPAHVPALGASFVAVADQGIVRVRLPGDDRFVDLPQAASVPVGTIVDARDGTIALSTALPDGSLQHASFRGARFKVRQAADGDGRTHLHLRGGSFAGCGRARGARTLASAAATGERKPVRRLWGKDRNGRFRTHGRDSVTTVRGTEWSVADRCDGTVTRVTKGAVDVRVRGARRVVRVSAGERYLARHRR